VIRRTNSRPSPSSNVVSGKNGFYLWNLVHRTGGLEKEEAELDERATEARGTGGSDCGSGVHFRVPVQTDLAEDWRCNIEDLCDQGSRLQAYRAVGERRLSVRAFNAAAFARRQSTQVTGANGYAVLIQRLD
jgi:hypothetical protein